MTTRTFTVRMDRCDSDIAADGLAAVFNVATDKEKYVAITEVRVVPKAINSDTTAAGCQGIMAMERISAATGGTLVNPVKFDTGAADLPSQVKFREHPTSVTNGDVLRRFGDCVSTYTIAKATGFMPSVRAPGVVDANDGSGRPCESHNVWHSDGIAATEPIVLRESEGLALVRRAYGVPQAMHVGLVVRVAGTGNTYRWMDEGVGTSDEIGQACIALTNESGSGVILEVHVVSFPDLGEENQPTYRLVKCEAAFDPRWPGTAATLTPHDTAASITDVQCFKGPMRVYGLSRGCGALVDYYSYQANTGGADLAFATTFGEQRVDCMRVWSGIGPYIRVTGTPNLLYDIFSRSEFEVWPGSRRGGEGVYDLPIILRPGEGLAVIGGSRGNIETSELAFLDIEFMGYVFTANAVWPAEDDVRDGVDYGPTGTDYDGDLVLPVEADVKLGVTYGADGTEYTGTYAGGGGGQGIGQGLHSIETGVP